MSWKYMAFCDLHVLFYLYLYLNAEDIIIKRVVWESIKSFIHKAGLKSFCDSEISCMFKFIVTNPGPDFSQCMP
jgi:hypothetical protein